MMSVKSRGEGFCPTGCGGGPTAHVGMVVSRYQGEPSRCNCVGAG